MLKSLIKNLQYQFITNFKGEGYVAKYYSNGQIQLEGKLENRKRVGIWRRYYRSGKIEKESDKNGWKEFYESGRIKSENSGEGQIDYYENGQILHESQKKIESSDPYFSEGYRTKSIGYYKNGKVKSEQLFFTSGHSKDYFSNRKIITYYKNGQIESSINHLGESWRSGSLGYTSSSEKKLYDKDGKWEFDYFHDGKCLWFYDNGKLKKELTYQKGKRHGQSKLYFPDGNIETLLSFKNDKEDGKWVDYNKDGSVIKEITFKDGKLWNGIYYDCYSEKFSKPEEYILKDGEFLWEELNSMNIWGNDWKIYMYMDSPWRTRRKRSDIEDIVKENTVIKVKSLHPVKNGKMQGQGLYFYDNGQIKSQKQFVNDKLHGECIYYHENSALQTKINFKDGIHLKEKQICYSDNGEIDHVHTYKKGKEFHHDSAGVLSADFQLDEKGNRNGITRTFYANGNIIDEGNVKFGKLNGEFKCYDINGNFKGSGIYRNGEPWEGYLINTNDENNLEEGLYKKGKRKGKHIILNINGEIIGKI